MCAGISRPRVPAARMIKQGQRTGTGSQRPILRIREPLSSAFIRDTEPNQWQTNPRDLDAEMITRLPVATALTTATFSDTFQGCRRTAMRRGFWRMANPR